MDLLTVVRYYGDQIQDDRGEAEIFLHGVDEMHELNDEVLKSVCNKPPGEDGVVGEAIDVMLCMADLINKHTKNSFTEEQFNDYVHKKCRKWLDKKQGTYQA